MKPSPLHLAIQSLPEEIKEWLSSERVILILETMYKNFNIQEDKARTVSDYIARLAIQDLDPRDFVNEVSHELNISFDSAQHLTKEIEERIFEPIATQLKRDVGVDVKLLYFGQPSAKRAGERPLPMSASQELEMPARTIKSAEITNRPEPLLKENNTSSPVPPAAFNMLPPEEKTSQSPAPAASLPTSTAPQPPAADSDMPFMLHQEGMAQPAMPEFSKEKPSVNIKIQVPRNAMTPKVSPQPISVRLETSSGKIQQEKVIHYSGFKSALTTPAYPQPATPAHNQAAPAPSAEQKTVPPIPPPPLTKGNTIDLRKTL